jgi:hypothetical protein
VCLNEIADGVDRCAIKLISMVVETMTDLVMKPTNRMWPLNDKVIRAACW